MSKGIICDRCGKTQEESGSSLVRMRDVVHFGFRKNLQRLFGYEEWFQLDLCDDCAKELYRWLKGDDAK